MQRPEALHDWLDHSGEGHCAVSAFLHAAQLSPDLVANTSEFLEVYIGHGRSWLAIALPAQMDTISEEGIPSCLAFRQPRCTHVSLR